MNITQESTGELTATVKVSFNQEDYQEQVDKQLKDYQRKANIPGFRPGKVPFGMVKKMFGKTVLADQIDKLLSEAIAKHIEDNKLEILGNPLPNHEKNQTMDLDSQTEFDFFFDLGFSPAVEPELSKKIKIDEYEIAVDDEEIEDQIKGICKKYGNFMMPEVSAEGDMIKGDFEELNDDGSVKEGGIRKSSSVFSEYMPDAKVKKQFTGLKVGDSLTVEPKKLVKNEFELNYLLGIKSEEAETLTSQFRFTVLEISRVEPAKPDAELFAKLFPNGEITTEEAFREKMREEVAAGHKNDSERKLLTDIQKALLDEFKFGLPDEFLKRYFIETNTDKNLSEEKIISEYDETSNALRWQILENNIIKKYEVKVGREDAMEYVKNYFRKNDKHEHAEGEDHEQHEKENEERLDRIAESILSNEKEARQIFQHLIDQKLIALYRDKLTINTKKATYKEFIDQAYKK
jgi:trigger factor